MAKTPPTAAAGVPGALSATGAAGATGGAGGAAMLLLCALAIMEAKGAPVQSPTLEPAQEAEAEVRGELCPGAARAVTFHKGGAQSLFHKGGAHTLQVQRDVRDSCGAGVEQWAVHARPSQRARAIGRSHASQGARARSSRAPRCGDLGAESST